MINLMLDSRAAIGRCFHTAVAGDRMVFRRCGISHMSRAESEQVLPRWPILV